MLGGGGLVPAWTGIQPRWRIVVRISLPCVADVSGANRWEGGHVVQDRSRGDRHLPKKQTPPLIPNAVAANRPKYILPLLLGSKWPRAKGVYREE